MKESPENDLIRLRHMLNAAHEVQEFVKGKTREALDEDKCSYALSVCR